MRIYGPCLLVLLIAINASASPAGDTAPARTVLGERDSATIIDGSDGVLPFPKVSRVQIRGKVAEPVAEFEPDYDSPPPEWNPYGTGGYSEWGPCKDNQACSLDIMNCYTRAYSRCTVRLRGTGNPCTSC